MTSKPVLKVVASASNDSRVSSENAPALKRLARAAGSVGGFMVRVLMMVLVALKTAAFYPLMWLQGVVSMACHFLAVVGIFALALGLLFGVDGTILWKIALASFIVFLLGWGYTGLVLMLAPGSMTLDGRFTENRARGE